MPNYPVAPLIDDAFLADIDDIRGIPGELGGRKFSVTVRVNIWTGGMPGAPDSAKLSTIDTELKVGQGTQSPRVRQVSTRDAIASGGAYTNQMLRIGPFTPGYASTTTNPQGGVAYDTVDPPVVAGQVKEIFFLLLGPGIPAPGAWFERVQEEAVSPTRHFLILRRSANQNP